MALVLSNLVQFDQLTKTSTFINSTGVGLTSTTAFFAQNAAGTNIALIDTSTPAITFSNASGTTLLSINGSSNAIFTNPGTAFRPTSDANNAFVYQNNAGTTTFLNIDSTSNIITYNANKLYFGAGMTAGSGFYVTALGGYSVLFVDVINYQLTFSNLGQSRNIFFFDSFNSYFDIDTLTFNNHNASTTYMVVSSTVTISVPSVINNTTLINTSNTSAFVVENTSSNVIMKISTNYGPSASVNMYNGNNWITTGSTPAAFGTSSFTTPAVYGNNLFIVNNINPSGTGSSSIYYYTYTNAGTLGTLQGPLTNSPNPFNTATTESPIIEFDPINNYMWVGFIRNLSDSGRLSMSLYTGVNGTPSAGTTSILSGLAGSGPFDNNFNVVTWFTAYGGNLFIGAPIYNIGQICYITTSFVVTLVSYVDPYLGAYGQGPSAATYYANTSAIYIILTPNLNTTTTILRRLAAFNSSGVNYNAITLPSITCISVCAGTNNTYGNLVFVLDSGLGCVYVYNAYNPATSINLINSFQFYSGYYPKFGFVQGNYLFIYGGTTTTTTTPSTDYNILVTYDLTGYVVTSASNAIGITPSIVNIYIPPLGYFPALTKNTLSASVPYSMAYLLGVSQNNQFTVISYGTSQSVVMPQGTIYQGSNKITDYMTNLASGYSSNSMILASSETEKIKFMTSNSTNYQNWGIGSANSTNGPMFINYYNNGDYVNTPLVIGASTSTGIITNTNKAIGRQIVTLNTTSGLMNINNNNLWMPSTSVSSVSGLTNGGGNGVSLLIGNVWYISSSVVNSNASMTYISFQDVSDIGAVSINNLSGVKKVTITTLNINNTTITTAFMDYDPVNNIIFWFCPNTANTAVYVMSVTSANTISAVFTNSGATPTSIAVTFLPTGILQAVGAAVGGSHLFILNTTTTNTIYRVATTAVTIDATYVITDTVNPVFIALAYVPYVTGGGTTYSLIALAANTLKLYALTANAYATAPATATLSLVAANANPVSIITNSVNSSWNNFIFVPDTTTTGSGGGTVFIYNFTNTPSFTACGSWNVINGYYAHYGFAQANLLFLYCGTTTTSTDNTVILVYDITYITNTSGGNPTPQFLYKFIPGTFTTPIQTFSKNYQLTTTNKAIALVQSGQTTAYIYNYAFPTGTLKTNISNIGTAQEMFMDNYTSTSTAYNTMTISPIESEKIKFYATSANNYQNWGLFSQTTNNSNFGINAYSNGALLNIPLTFSPAPTTTGTTQNTGLMLGRQLMTVNTTSGAINTYNNNQWMPMGAATSTITLSGVVVSAALINNRLFTIQTSTSTATTNLVYYQFTDPSNLSINSAITIGAGTATQAASQTAFVDIDTVGGYFIAAFNFSATVVNINVLSTITATPTLTTGAVTLGAVPTIGNITQSTYMAVGGSSIFLVNGVGATGIIYRIAVSNLTAIATTYTIAGVTAINSLGYIDGFTNLTYALIVVATTPKTIYLMNTTNTAAASLALTGNNGNPASVITTRGSYNGFIYIPDITANSGTGSIFIYYVANLVTPTITYVGTWQFINGNYGHYGFAQGNYLFLYGGTSNTPTTNTIIAVYNVSGIVNTATNNPPPPLVYNFALTSPPSPWPIFNKSYPLTTTNQAILVGNSGNTALNLYDYGLSQGSIVTPSGTITAVSTIFTDNVSLSSSYNTVVISPIEGEKIKFYSTSTNNYQNWGIVGSTTDNGPFSINMYNNGVLSAVPFKVTNTAGAVSIVVSTTNVQLGTSAGSITMSGGASSTAASNNITLYGGSYSTATLGINVINVSGGNSTNPGTATVWGGGSATQASNVLNLYGGYTDAAGVAGNINIYGSGNSANASTITIQAGNFVTTPANNLLTMSGGGSNGGTATLYGGAAAAVGSNVLNLYGGNAQAGQINIYGGSGSATANPIVTIKGTNGTGATAQLNMSAGGPSGTVTIGNTTDIIKLISTATAAGTAANAGSINFTTSTTGANIIFSSAYTGTNGSFLFTTATNNTNAFSVTNSTPLAIFSVDTSTPVVKIGNATSSVYVNYNVFGVADNVITYEFTVTSVNTANTNYNITWPAGKGPANVRSLTAGGYYASLTTYVPAFYGPTTGNNYFTVFATTPNIIVQTGASFAVSMTVYVWMTTT